MPRSAQPAPSPVRAPAPRPPAIGPMPNGSATQHVAAETKSSYTPLLLAAFLVGGPVGLLLIPLLAGKKALREVRHGMGVPIDDRRLKTGAPVKDEEEKQIVVDDKVMPASGAPDRGAYL